MNHIQDEQPLLSDSKSSPNRFQIFIKRLKEWWQVYNDKIVPYATGRWISTLVLGALYILRVLYVQGFYIITYALGIYHLNIFIAFLTPKIDPAFSDMDESEPEDGPSLPTRQSEEFRPFIRRLPEYKFWYGATKSIVIAFMCTFVKAFDIPVFWPILVVYFITLFGVTMKRQIRHMIKYRYIPFTHGKKKYQGKEDGAAATTATMGNAPTAAAVGNSGKGFISK